MTIPLSHAGSRMLRRKPSLLHRTLRLAPDERKCPLIAVYIYVFYPAACVMLFPHPSPFLPILSTSFPKIHADMLQPHPPSFLDSIPTSLPRRDQRVQSFLGNFIYNRLDSISSCRRRWVSSDGNQGKSNRPKIHNLLHVIDSVPRRSSIHCQGSAGSFSIRLVSRPRVLNVRES